MVGRKREPAGMLHRGGTVTPGGGACTPTAYYVIILIRVIGLQPWEFLGCNLKPSWVQGGQGDRGNRSPPIGRWQV